MLLYGAIEMLELILVIQFIAHQIVSSYITCFIYNNGISVAGPV